MTPRAARPLLFSPMLLLADGSLNSALVAAIREFRARIYAADHVTIDEAPDPVSWHAAYFVAGSLAGCLRYTRAGGGLAHIGGWCVSPDHRHTRAALELALAPFRLAAALGDHRGVAHATTRHGSARILRKLGGRVTATYFSVKYGCEMQRLEFALADAPRKLLAAA